MGECSQPARERHAHEDYQIPVTADALDHGFTSFEADVWP